MAALALNGGLGGPRRPRRSPITLGRVMAVGALVLVAYLVWTFMSAQIVSKRPNEMKTTQVILPPPPPPPPPEVKPVEKPPEPTDAPPVEEPVDTPPPPDQPPQQQSSDPVQGDNALTAREGAGPSNYGLAVGNGSGGRIGGRPGGTGNGFATYGELTRREVSAVVQRGGRDVSRGSYTVQLIVAVDAEGRITDVRIMRSSGDARRDAAIQRLLAGYQLSQRPPAGLPVMRIELNARNSA